MIETNYDPVADVMHVGFGRDCARYDSAPEVASGVYVEFDTDGQAIGVEVTRVRYRSDQAGTIRSAAE